MTRRRHKGSLGAWLDSFEIGEVRFRPDDPATWPNHPPPSRTRHDYQFACAPYWAVPADSPKHPPTFMWRIERLA